jgi:hypothetical protein
MGGPKERENFDRLLAEEGDLSSDGEGCGDVISEDEMIGETGECDISIEEQKEQENPEDELDETEDTAIIEAGPSKRRRIVL